MCYNVLCDKYATRQLYGYCPSWALSWDYRKKNIMQEILGCNADIISLQVSARVEASINGLHIYSGWWSKGQNMIGWLVESILAYLKVYIQNVRHELNSGYFCHFLFGRKWRQSSTIITSCRSWRSRVMMGSSVQSPEPGPCQSRTANMWTDVQFFTRQKSMTCIYTYKLTWVGQKCYADQS